jgi:hypothetical protein
MLSCCLKYIKHNQDSMIIKKIQIILIFTTLTGCVQNSAFFGSALTIARTGNVTQAGLSYGSNKAITKLTGKTPFENIQQIVAPKKDDGKILSSTKKNLKKVSEITFSPSQ